MNVPVRQEAPHGRKVAVRFEDGELLCGAYRPGREGCFLFPADAGSDNLRPFVVAAATVEVEAGPSAELPTRTALAAANGPGDRAAASGRPGEARRRGRAPTAGS